MWHRPEAITWLSGSESFAFRLSESSILMTATENTFAFTNPKPPTTKGIEMKPRLMLLGMEPVEYPALQIWAHSIQDGSGQLVCGAHSKREAERIRDRYQVRYPQRKFYVQ